MSKCVEAEINWCEEVFSSMKPEIGTAYMRSSHRGKVNPTKREFILSRLITYLYPERKFRLAFNSKLIPRQGKVEN